MIKTIEKKCILGEHDITLSFQDTRDDYVCPTALGDIGEIIIYEDCIFITPNNYDDKIIETREKELQETFKEIFGTDKIDYSSNEYYQKIKNMIENGTLKSLGYTITTYKEETEEYEDIISYYNNKQTKRH